jgi:hypothetical protein
VWLGTGDGYIYIFSVKPIKSAESSQEPVSDQPAESKTPKAEAPKNIVTLRPKKFVRSKRISFMNDDILENEQNDDDIFVTNDFKERSLKKWKSERFIRMEEKEENELEEEEHNKLLSQVLQLSYANLADNYDSNRISKFILESETLNDESPDLSYKIRFSNAPDFDEFNYNYISDDLWSGSSRKSWVLDREASPTRSVASAHMINTIRKNNHAKSVLDSCSLSESYGRANKFSPAETKSRMTTKPKLKYSKSETRSPQISNDEETDENYAVKTSCLANKKTWRHSLGRKGYKSF